ncbi:MAG: polysaccharide deacetylase family protein [Arenimonas sp.]
MRHSSFAVQRKQLVVACMALFASIAAFADGPAVVAKVDHSLWHQPVNTIGGFDKASRASILTYVLVLKEMQKQSDAQMLASFKIKSINRASVEKWLKKENAISLANYRFAMGDCHVQDWTCVSDIKNVDDLQQQAAKALAKIPNDLSAWHNNLKQFANTYVAEQLRLAALFPRVTSEIDVFNNQEWTGDNIPDKHFFLSFDDGPTAALGSTDDTLSMLAKQKKTAVFFMLGENLSSRSGHSSAVVMQTLYKNQCVASHGWQHQSHAKWDQWQSSIQRTEALLKTTFGNEQIVPYFRPPYGQRKADSGAFFKAEGLQVALWNIDSQDWNNNVSINDVSNRMITLMLIKRHGMLLFHDIHPKAKVALPVMFESFGDAVTWGDCKQLAANLK